MHNKGGGDYQTAKRMKDKRTAIQCPNLEGKTVLDIGCDFGYWSALASEEGAVRVVGVDKGRVVRGHGFVDVVARNKAQRWPRCEFVKADLGKEWPKLGKFDVVFCFSVYHHLFRDVEGDHRVIWQWLRYCTARNGVLLWEGPVDTKDSIAATRAKEVSPDAYSWYTREKIMEAANEYFDVEHVGPAIHRPHREVWHCYVRGEGIRGTDKDSGHRMSRRGQSSSGVQGGEDERRAQYGGLVSVSRNLECEGEEAGRSVGGSGTTNKRDRGGDTNRSASVVDGKARATRRNPRGRAARSRKKHKDPLPRVRNADQPTYGDSPEEWRSGLLHPEWALVIGGGSGVWDEVLAWEEIYGKPWDGLVVAANDVGSHWPRYLDHWVTLHPDRMTKWRAKREAHGFPSGYRTWGRRKGVLDYQIRPWAGGASGMLAIQVAQLVGAQKAILCGVPMSPTPHFVESLVHKKTQPWTACAGHWRAWERHYENKMQGWVKSMSGKTQNLLGAPTLEWLLDEEETSDALANG